MSHWPLLPTTTLSIILLEFIVLFYFIIVMCRLLPWQPRAERQLISFNIGINAASAMDSICTASMFRTQQNHGTNLTELGREWVTCIQNALKDFYPSSLGGSVLLFEERGKDYTIPTKLTLLIIQRTSKHVAWSSS